eukprot:9483441-Ditylum_brightwellii.AAC.1
MSGSLILMLNHTSHNHERKFSSTRRKKRSLGGWHAQKRGYHGLKTTVQETSSEMGLPHFTGIQLCQDHD